MWGFTEFHNAEFHSAGLHNAGFHNVWASQDFTGFHSARSQELTN
jgi:hypothetical protein